MASISSAAARKQGDWLYLTAVADLYARPIVGWWMGEHLASRLVVDALERAVWRRLLGEGSALGYLSPVEYE